MNPLIIIDGHSQVAFLCLKTNVFADSFGYLLLAASLRPEVKKLKTLLLEDDGLFRCCCCFLLHLLFLLLPINEWPENLKAFGLRRR